MVELHRGSLGTSSPEHMKTEEKEPGKGIADAKALGLEQLSGFEEQKGDEPSRSAGQREQQGKVRLEKSLPSSGRRQTSRY